MKKEQSETSLLWRAGGGFEPLACVAVNDWLSFSPAPLRSVILSHWPFSLLFLLSHWTGLESYELILVKYSCAREGLKIERYIKPALRRGRASLLPAACQSRMPKGGERQTTASSFSAASFQLIPLQVLQRGAPLCSDQQLRVEQAVTNFLPSLLTAVSSVQRPLVSSSRALKRHFNVLNKHAVHKKN